MAVLLAVGSQAPDFRLPATTGDTVSLSHYRGKRNLILVFYVGDNTPDCNRQLASLQEADLYPYFLRFGAAGRMIQYIVVRSARC